MQRWDREQSQTLYLNHKGLARRSHTHTHKAEAPSFKIRPCEHSNKGMLAGTTPLHLAADLAAESGDVNKVRLLIKQGEHDVNSRDSENKTLLHYACAR